MIVYLGSGIMNNIIVVRMKNKKSVLVNAFGKTDLIVKSIVGFLELFFISFHEISDFKLKLEEYLYQNFKNSSDFSVLKFKQKYYEL